MKNINSKFLITVLMLAVTSVFVIGQKKVLFIGRSQYIEVASPGYMSDKNLYDSLAAYGFEMTYLWNDTYKDATEYDYSGFDGVFMNETVDSKAMAAFGAALGIGIAALGTGIGQRIGMSKACEGAARNPAATPKIQTLLIIGLAMIESLAIYALLVSLGILINLKLFF